jgi:hypothetical protein
MIQKRKKIKERNEIITSLTTEFLSFPNSCCGAFYDAVSICLYSAKLYNDLPITGKDLWDVGYFTALALSIYTIQRRKVI